MRRHVPLSLGYALTNITSHAHPLHPSLHLTAAHQLTTLTDFVHFIFDLRHGSQTIHRRIAVLGISMASSLFIQPIQKPKMVQRLGMTDPMVLFSDLTVFPAATTS
jgi:hypothetical protein